VWLLATACYLSPVWYVLLDYLTAFFNDTPFQWSLFFNGWTRRGSYRFAMYLGCNAFGFLVSSQTDVLLEYARRYGELIVYM
jgi:hypothetical protein